MDFYKDVVTYKKNYKITNADLAAVVDKKEGAFTVALSRKSFSPLEVEKLSAFLVEKAGEKLQSTTRDNNQDASMQLCVDGKIDYNKLTQHVFDVWEDLKNYRPIKMLIEDAKKDAQIEVLLKIEEARARAMSK